jgi:DNA polymerase-3 subunit delta
MPPLDFDAFRRAIKKGEILPAYYLHGDVDLLKDDGLRDLLAAALDPSTRDFNLDRRRAAEMTVEDFLTLAQTPPMMAPRRAVVLTEIEDLQQRRERAMKLRSAIVDYLANPAAELLLVLVQSSGEKVDADLAKRTASVAFAPLTPDKLEKWIGHRAKLEGIELEPEAARHLHESVGDDLPQLAAEIAKLRGAVPPGHPVTAADVADLVGIQRGETIHSLVDAVTSRDVARATGMVRHLLEGPGMSGVRLIMSLGTALCGVAFARALLDSGKSSSGAASELEATMFKGRPWGLRGYGEEARRWSRDAALWTMPELERAIAELLRADKRLKSTSLGGEAEIVLDGVLAMAGARVAA